MTSKNFTFEVRRNAKLPLLAWLCRVDLLRHIAILECGCGVEATSRMFIEGCWAGDFAAGLVHQAEAVFGSGGVIENTRLTFVPCTATTDSLFYRLNEEEILVSNSLPFLLAASNDRLDPRYHNYDLDNHSIIRGINQYRRDIPSIHGGIQRLMHRNLVIEQGIATEQDKSWAPRFPDYSAYFNFLDRTLGDLMRNARSPARAQPLRILTTQSRGYDTTAVNALASKYGVEIAFTCPTSKGAGRFAGSDLAFQENDDGSEIAASLGIPCVAINRRSFVQPFEGEHLYFAALDNPQDLNLLDVNARVSGPSLLLTGTLGEIWYPARIYGEQPGFCTDDLQRGDLSGHGLSEVRLHYGFVQCAVPYIGARRRADILTITESEEMSSWSIGGAYDRPIPRRIAESVGVSRNMFGQNKLASVTEFPPPRTPLSAALRAEYYAFLKQQGIAGLLRIALLPLVQRCNEWLWFSPKRYYMERLINLLPGRTRGQSILLWRALNGRIFCFAVGKCSDAYRAARLDS